jgi:hypothetical protein
MITGPPPKFHGTRDNLQVEWMLLSHPALGRDYLLVMDEWATLPGSLPVVSSDRIHRPCRRILRRAVLLLAARLMSTYTMFVQPASPVSLEDCVSLTGADMHEPMSMVVGRTEKDYRKSAPRHC